MNFGVRCDIWHTHDNLELYLPLYVWLNFSSAYITHSPSLPTCSVVDFTWKLPSGLNWPFCKPLGIYSTNCCFETLKLTADNTEISTVLIKTAALFLNVMTSSWYHKHALLCATCQLQAQNLLLPRYAHLDIAGVLTWVWLQCIIFQFSFA